MMRSMEEIDKLYKLLGCLGRGGFGSVFLARKQTPPHRIVAIKVMPLKNECAMESYQRELDAARALKRDDTTEEGEERDMGTVFFRDCFQSTSGFGFIVMNYINGGTLADVIDKRAAASSMENFAERRIAWYILQLSEALAYIHGRNVSHFDIKSENILVDEKAGGKLVITGFGTSVRPGSEKIGFTQSYAPPELLAAHRNGKSLQDIHPVGVDSFGLGCIALELLLCCRLCNTPALEASTVADLATSGRLETAFVDRMGDRSPYSEPLRKVLIRRLLDPSWQTRASPSQFAQDLRQHPRSPLLSHTLQAAHPLTQGDHLTMDNIQLGCFVQRGPDWQDPNSSDGGGCIGVVTKLDPDALYTEVTWPTGHFDTYRIGANCKMELTVGPNTLPNGMRNGFLSSGNSSKYNIGTIFQSSTEHAANGMVIVGIAECGILVAPPPSFRVLNDYHSIRKLPQPPGVPALLNTMQPKDPEPHPQHWDLSHGEMFEVVDHEERSMVLNRFHANKGGVSAKEYSVCSVQRVLSVRLWDAYDRRRQVVAMENWGFSNEQSLFHGTGETSPLTIIHDPVGFDPRFCKGGKTFGRGSYFAVDARYSHEFAHKTTDDGTTPVFQMFLARVAIGRVDHHHKGDQSIRRPRSGCHSVMGKSRLSSNGDGVRVTGQVHVIYETTTQAYPEYLISYKKVITAKNIPKPGSVYNPITVQ